MRRLRRVSLAAVCLFTVGAWAQGAPQVFVSTGTAGKIYSLNTATGTTTLLVSTSGADYEGMVVAPDNAPVDNVPANSHPYLVYACDSNNGKIWRFDPNDATTLETVYTGTSPSHPQCGRITSNGDLVVSSKDANSGLWIFTGVANVPLGSAVPSPTQLGATITGGSQGLAQKNTGDMLVVDSSNNKVLKSNFPGFATAGNFIASGLSTPVGIARSRDGFIFVSNQGNNSLRQYDAAGQHGTTCQSFQKKDTPFFMQISLDDTLYVALSESNKGLVQSVNARTCQAVQSFSIPSPAVGIALPPTTATLSVSSANVTTPISFGFAAFELNNVSGACSGSITVSLLSAEGIRSLIDLTESPAGALDPAVNLGLDGFEAVFNTGALNGCTAADTTTTNFQIAGLVSTSVTNPEIVVCDDDNTNCQPSAVSLAQIGVWPIGGYLPQDITTGGKKTLKCNVFLVNSHPTGLTGQEDGTFCGFQSPLNNTFPSGSPAVISAGKSIPVKFRLAPGTHSSCQSAPYLTDARAILSVAQIADRQGNPTFVPIGLVSNGSSGLGQPLFKSDNNQQYLFNWDSGSCIMPDGSTKTCAKGTYSLTVVFLTDNTANTVPSQNIYTNLTTQVILK